jgi:hypothetical protein
VVNRGKKILCDLESVRENGIEYFLENHGWPVSEEEFHSLADSLRDTYIALILQQDDELFEIAQVEFSLVGQLLHIVQFNYVKNYARDERKEIVLGRDAKQYIDPDWQQIGDYYRSQMQFPFGLFKRKLRRIVKNILFNKHLGYWRLIQGLLFSKSVIGVGSYDRIKREYIEKNLLFCDHIDWPDMIGIVDFSREEKQAEEFAENFMERIAAPFLHKIRESGGLFARGLPYGEIKSIWRRRVTDIYRVISAIRPMEADKLLVTEAAKPFSKVITAGFRKNGGSAVHFSHGNDSGLLNQKWLHQTTISHAYRYVFETKKICSRFKCSSPNRPIESRTESTFESIQSGIFKELREKNNFSSSISGEVMLIGYPMNLYRNPDEAYMFFNYKLHLEYKVIAALREIEEVEKVVYKAHPDRLPEIKGIYEDHVDEINTEKFERIVGKDVVLIFTYVSTTVFCYAINLPVPIVLIKIEGTPWYDAMDQTLSERVAFVDCHYVNGIPCFEKDRLRQSLIEAKSKINVDVAESITG